MLDFNLQLLGWNSFQDLALTICRVIHDIPVQSFSAGPDGGRDGASILSIDEPSNPLGRVAIQCKHSAVVGKVVASTYTSELPKVNKLVKSGLCDTYVFFTNLRLSARTTASMEQALKKQGVKHVIIYGGESLNLLLSENKQLRGLIPRMYGLGDLSEIIDSRLYDQTRAMLDEEDLKRFVPTDAYRQTISALADHGFVLLLGEPASGKSSIMRAAAIHAADLWQVEPLWLPSLQEFNRHWNPDRSDQLFLVDDVFGATSFDPESADIWNRSVSSLRSSMRKGAKFIMTSRDYVFGAAKHLLKRDELPVSRQAEVVIHVERLSIEERRAIVYNHLRLGNQEPSFRSSVKQHLMRVTSSPIFLPESARRLGDRSFTVGVDPESLADVSRFLTEPREYLRSVISSMQEDLRAALVVLVVLGGDVPSAPGAVEESLLKRLDLTYSRLVDAMQQLDGSFVRVIHTDDLHWIARHPTVIDAICDWMSQRPDRLDIYCESAPLRVLTTQTTCGKEVRGALSLPTRLWSVVLSRLFEPSCPRDILLRFLLFRCSPACIRSDPTYADLAIERALVDGRLRPPLDNDVSMRFLLRMWGMGLLDPLSMERFAEAVLCASIAGLDPYPLRNPSIEELLFSLNSGPGLMENYLTELTDRINEGLLDEVAGRINAFAWDVDRVDVFAPLLDLIDALTTEYELQLDTAVIARARRRIVNWVGESGTPLPTLDPTRRMIRGLFGTTQADNAFSDVDAD